MHGGPGDGDQGRKGTAGAAASGAASCFATRPGLRADDGLLKAYLDPDPVPLSRLLLRRLDLDGADLAPGSLPLRVTHRPLLDWQFALPEDREAMTELPRRRAPPNRCRVGHPLRIRGCARDLPRPGARRRSARSTTPLGDLRLNAALHWGPGRGEGDSFGSLPDAHRLIRADALGAAGLDGEGVKVVIIDQGVDASRLPPGSRFMGGWWKPGQPGAVPPGQAAKDNHHGTMIARNVLALAPRAMIFDCPLIPPRILGQPAGLPVGRLRRRSRAWRWTSCCSG